MRDALVPTTAHACERTAEVDEATGILEACEFSGSDRVRELTGHNTALLAQNRRGTWAEANTELW